MIREFIDKNKIEFTEGQRNSSTVIIIGYAQHLGLNETQLKKELSKEIKADKHIKAEVERLFSYCQSNNYAKYWKTKSAKSEYKF